MPLHFALIIKAVYVMSQPANEVKYIRSTDEQKRILQACHLDPTSGHMGVKRTLSRITERFMWLGVAKDVQKLVSKTLTHNNNKLYHEMLAK